MQARVLKEQVSELVCFEHLQPQATAAIDLNEEGMRASAYIRLHSHEEVRKKKRAQQNGLTFRI